MPAPVLLHIGLSPAVLLVDEPGIDVGMAWDGKTKARVPDREAHRLADFDMNHFLQRGFGVADVDYGDIEPDFDGGRSFGVRTLFGPQTEPRKPDEWGRSGPGHGVSAVSWITFRPIRRWMAPRSP
jgi:hypothetical protein